MKDISTSPRILEIRRKRRIRKIWKIVFFIVLFFLVIAGLALLSENRKMKVESIVVEGNHIIDEDEIKKEIDKSISGKYLYLFSRSNSLIYPHKKIYDNLLINFPRIESLVVKRNNFKTIQITIVERLGSFLYCGNDIPQNREDVGENCYFVNNDGFIFDEAPYFSGNIYFKYYLNLKDETKIIGQQMIKKEDFHEMTRFIDNITNLGFKPIYIVMNKEETNYLYLKHEINSSVPKIIFKNNTDPDIIYEDLSLSMEKKEFADEINSKYNTLLYIDLRFKNKILYKFSTQGGSVQEKQ